MPVCQKHECFGCADLFPQFSECFDDSRQLAWMACCSECEETARAAALPEAESDDAWEAVLIDGVTVWSR